MRAVMPQVLATAKLTGQLAPVFASLPTDLGKFVDSINDLSRRLAPLGQLAETAGGLFSLRIPGMTRPSASPAQPPLPVPAPEPERPTKPKPAPKKTAKKAGSKKSAAKKRSAAG